MVLGYTLSMNRINTTVITSSAEYFSNDQQINPYYHEESVDVAGAVREHETIGQMLTSAGVTVRKVDVTPDSQDGVYTANWALIRGKKAVLARLPNARKAEETWAETKLIELGLDVVRVPEDWHFSGQGDALPCGNYLFCGSGYRSDERAQAFAAEQLGYERVQLQTIPQLDEQGLPKINPTSGWADSFYYDIDLALAIVQGPSDNSLGTIAYCPEAFTPSSQAILAGLEGFDKIIVSEHEARKAFACNLVSTGEAVVMSAHAPQLRAELEQRGIQVHTPEIRELVKGGGYIRCTTLSVNE